MPVANPGFVDRASLARREALRSLRDERAALAQLCDTLHQVGQGQQLQEVAMGLGMEGAVQNQAFAFVQSHVPQIQQVHAVTPEMLDRATAQRTLEQANGMWEMRHDGIMEATCPRVDLPRVQLSQCMAAQRCVCHGDGLLDRHFMNSLKKAFKALKAENASWLQKARSAEIVLRFEWKDFCSNTHRHIRRTQTCQLVGRGRSAISAVWQAVGS